MTACITAGSLRVTSKIERSENMAEGGFDDMEMEELNGYKGPEDSSNEQLQTEYVDLNKKLNTLIHKRDNENNESIRVRYDTAIEKVKNYIAYMETDLDRRSFNAESRFIDDDDGKTITIKGPSEPKVTAPSAEFVHDDTAVSNRFATLDKKTFLREVLGSEIRAGDSKDLVERVKEAVGLASL